MLNVDISNIWGDLSLPEMLSCEQDIFQAHKLLAEGRGPGGDYLGWLTLPTFEETEEIHRIRMAAERIRSDSEVFVVVGIGGATLGAKAAVELACGCYYNMKKRGPRIFFAGDNLSTRAWQELCQVLEGKEFSINIISKSGTTPEPALATRALRWMLERKYGSEKARRRIYVTTDPLCGGLRKLAKEEGYETFTLPVNITEDYSVLTAAGLLPMAVAGLDPRDVMMGAVRAKKALDIRSFENPVWQYAAIRHMLSRKGKRLELLCSYEPCFRSFGHWWQQLFAGNGSGLFPVPAELPGALYSLGRRIEQGQPELLETVLRFTPPAVAAPIQVDWRDLDGLKFLEGRNLTAVEEQSFQSTVNRHTDNGVPMVVLQTDVISAETLGELFYFFELAAALSAYLLEADPADRSCAEGYKNELYELLGKPNC